MKHEFETLDELQTKLYGEEPVIRGIKMTETDVETVIAKEENLINDNNRRFGVVYFSMLDEIVDKLKELTNKDRIDIKEYFKEIAPVFNILMKRTKDRRTKIYYMVYFYEILRMYIQYEYKIIEILTRWSNIGFKYSQEELIEMRDIYIELSGTKTSIEDLNRDFGILNTN